MKIIMVLLMVFYALTGYGQNTKSPIEIKKKMGTVFVCDGKSLTPGSMINIMKDNPEALQEMQTAKKSYLPALACSFSGGFCVGWAITPLIVGEQPYWGLMALGAGLIVVSIPLNSSYIRHAKKAVGIYNNGIQSSGLKNGYEINLGLTGNGIGVQVYF